MNALGPVSKRHFRARASTPATVATLATPAQLFLKNQWLACMLRAKCGCDSDATVATVGLTLVLVGAVVLAKNFEGRAKRLAPSRRGTVLRGCLGGAPFEAI